jgi:mannose-6-phosphate isomerase-like protein (cupin superfamily)
MNTQLVAAGTRIVNPLNRQTFIFTNPVEREDVAEFDVLLAEGGVSDVKEEQHIHPKSDEYFTVRSGLLKVVIDGREHLVQAGETIMVPRGQPHMFRNGHDGDTLMTLRFEPGLKFLRFFLNFAIAPTARPDWFDAEGGSSPLLGALALNAFPDLVYGVGQPIWMQKALFAALAPIARMKGYYLPFEAAERKQIARAPVPARMLEI